MGSPIDPSRTRCRPEAAGTPASAIIAGLGVGAALLAAHARLGQVAMTLSPPMVGVGLSYPSLGTAGGLAAAIALVRVNPAAWAYSLAAIAALGACGATHRSRWYLTPAFTTFLVFLLLLYARPQDAASRFDERLLETALGVRIAYTFSLALPTPRQRRNRPST